MKTTTPRPRGWPCRPGSRDARRKSSPAIASCGRFGIRATQGDLPLPGGLTWHSRSGRPLAEIKEVTAVSGNTITFSTPVHITYTTAKLAQLVRYTGSDNIYVQRAGVEDMTHHGRVGRQRVVPQCRVFVGEEHRVRAATGTPAWTSGTRFRIEVRDRYIHDTINPYPGGGGYALSMQHGTSEVLIENNIIVGANKLMVARSAGAGSVVGYNYVDNAFIGNYPGWVEVGLNGSHMVGSHHMLFEGNLSFNYDSDDTWGNALAMTVFRNHLTGHRRDFPDGDNVRAVGPDVRLLVAHLRRQRPGRSGTHGWLDVSRTRATAPTGTRRASGERSSIWKLGYAPGAWGQAPDPKVRSTVVREGNFDYVTNSVRWDHEPRALPDSLYLTVETRVLRRPALAVGGPDRGRPRSGRFRHR